MPINHITSTTAIPIDRHFRVSAGPGAGKTHWLVAHIKNVLRTSKSLGKARKIACISYTNVAVESIINRLGNACDRVEVSTIHSFLYKHVLKPYGGFIANAFGLNFHKVDGHDETILSNYTFLKDWKEVTKQQRITEDDKVIEAFRQARWRLNDDGNLEVKTNYPIKANGYSIKNSSYFEYKKLAWAKGVVHHDDVLFFSFEIVRQFPFVLKVIRSKFPYFFVDEFQDTNPIQTKILEEIAKEETTIGVIGDVAQSIYGFQGANPQDFTAMNVSGIADYIIPDNWRSTDSIITVLNSIRLDIQQVGKRRVVGEKPKILVGSKEFAVSTTSGACSDEKVFSLSRDNVTTNVMKWGGLPVAPGENVLSKLHSIDSNSDRRKLVLACIKGVELAREKRFKEAIKELERVFRETDGKLFGRKQAFKYLLLLTTKYDDFKGKSLFDFLDFLNKNISQVSGLRTGSIKAFYDSHSFQEASLCTKIPEHGGNHRTIHKAKGAEFQNVLLVLNDEKELAAFKDPNLIVNEEHRIVYVAISRAISRLFISVPALSEQLAATLSARFEIVRKNEEIG